MTNLVPLEKWNALKFDGRYTMKTLRCWARSGYIKPPAQKVGRDWLVQSDAVFHKPGKPVRTIPISVDMEIQPVDPLVLAILSK
ncbi:excisionase [Methylomicrobium sp. Wu6]|uniref:excisionase n=1 Tax=Methylomicrobium sp. Wu6 TaxID=3107928 RepID=UPI002DD67500|nr:excisionase [Methylomicrobium sp. Wu6]MEC4747564.1 excisionase [Methylomicrobium sp. Wu6]